MTAVYTVPDSPAATRGCRARADRALPGQIFAGDNPLLTDLLRSLDAEHEL
jgi:hypothetical protein